MRKEEDKFTDDLVPYMKHAKECTRKLLELRNTFSRVACYLVSISESVAFTYAKEKHTEKKIREIRETNPVAVT